MNKAKYEILLAELAEVIKQKNDMIVLQKYEIESLKKKVALAEKSAAIVYK